VPRTEDVGIDVIATLLRQDGRKLFAEESFYAQLKAGSVEEVSFSSGSVDWLKSLRLPMFFGKTDLGSATLSLYSCHRLLIHLHTYVSRDVKVAVDIRF